MANQALEAQEKKELVSKGESTSPSRYYVPSTDIHETDEALIVTMEVPGVDRRSIDVKVEDDVLRVEARIDPTKYQDMQPLYTEYNVGHFSRSFSLPHVIDQGKIAAALQDGVLTLTLHKVQKAQPRQIEIG